jgi:hypothetical protein
VTYDRFDIAGKRTPGTSLEPLPNGSGQDFQASPPWCRASLIGKAGESTGLRSFDNQIQSESFGYFCPPVPTTG